MALTRKQRADMKQSHANDPLVMQLLADHEDLLLAARDVCRQSDPAAKLAEVDGLMVQFRQSLEDLTEKHRQALRQSVSHVEQLRERVR